MNPKSKYGVLLLSSVLVTYAIVGGMLHRVNAQDGSYRELALFNEVLDKVRNDYVDKPSSDLMLRIMRGQLYRTRIPRYVTGYTIPHKTGDFLPYVGDDVGMLEAPGRTIILSVFTGSHFGSGETLENAIGLVARDVADYFAYR